MKKNPFFSLTLFLFAIITLLFIQNKEKESNIDILRIQHKFALENSPFNKTKNLSKEDRKAKGLPPNAYNERMWELTLDPQTGRPMPERVFELQQELKLQRETSRGVGGDANNAWIDRGPNNQGGRTRGIMFDPNDTTDFNRVFAGGVSGGLWVNNDITSSSSSWTLVPGIGANISVNVIISDPNNSNTFYIGSGESYTGGPAVGRGIWKSTDAGVTWTNIFGGYTSFNNTTRINGIFYINDLIARDIGSGNTELYAAVAGASYSFANSPNNFHSLSEMGLYKSTDNGSNWTRFNITYPDDANNFNWENTFKNPNDIELDKNNNIWFTTISNAFGGPGGDIYQSTNGTSFTLMHTFSGADRTEIEPSQNNVGTFWILTSESYTANIYTTINDFANVTQITTEPNDADTGIPAADFTRGQAWYDLEIEADANDNLIVGGVDLFRSTDNGANWSQISKWYNFAGVSSVVHADQQAIVFRPGSGNGNKVVFGTDGGVFYSDDITLASGSTTNITSRNKDYNTVQFYYGSIDLIDGGDGDDLAGGTQDNGTQIKIDASAGANGFTDPFGGDGGYTEIDNGGAYMIQSFPRNNHRFINYPTINNAYYITATKDGLSPDGSFINEAVLDTNKDIFYSNSSTGTFSIERTSNFVAGAGDIVNTSLTDMTHLTSSPTAFKVSPFTPGSTKLFVGLDSGKLLRIDNADGIPTWTDITGGSFVGSISDIEFGIDETEIFVTMHNYGVVSIWFTTDDGINWSSKEGDLPDLPVKCILQNTLIAKELIIGTELGVWSTEDYTVANPVWVQAYNGMSDVTVVDLDVRTSDNVILATTHGRGFFTSQFTSTPLGLDDNDLVNNSIKVFPTVSNGEFSILSNNSLGNVDMRIYTITGQKVYNSNFELSNVKKNFNLSLSSGLYLIKLTGNNFEEIKRIIVE